MKLINNNLILIVFISFINSCSINQNKESTNNGCECYIPRLKVDCMKSTDLDMISPTGTKDMQDYVIKYFSKNNILYLKDNTSDCPYLSVELETKNDTIIYARIYSEMIGRTKITDSVASSLEGNHLNLSKIMSDSMVSEKITYLTFRVKLENY